MKLQRILSYLYGTFELSSLILITGEVENFSSSTFSLNHTTNLEADVATYQGRIYHRSAKRFIISAVGLDSTGIFGSYAGNCRTKRSVNARQTLWTFSSA